MWPFSKKWNPPAPQLTMLVSLANPEIPSIVMVANPSGEDGAVLGMAGPAGGKPTPETMLTPMQEGEYVAISPARGMCTLRVERGEPDAEPLSIDPEMLEPSGLTEEMLAKFNSPAWRVIIEMGAPGDDTKDTVLFATRLAQRLAALGDGVVMDTRAYRFFGPEGWVVEEPNPEFDVRQHVHIHMDSDSFWVHTHGLLKFGRPEIEIYDVPPDLGDIAAGTLLDVSQYLITNAALIEPGQTCGDPNQPFHARVGTRNREEHWQHVPALEFVDVGERGKPVSSGASKALAHIAAS